MFPIAGCCIFDMFSTFNDPNRFYTLLIIVVSMVVVLFLKLVFEKNIVLIADAIIVLCWL